MSYILSDSQGSLSTVELPPDLYKCGGTDGCGGNDNAINAPFTTDYPHYFSPYISPYHIFNHHAVPMMSRKHLQLLLSSIYNKAYTEVPDHYSLNVSQFRQPLCTSKSFAVHENMFLENVSKGIATDTHRPAPVFFAT